jgi:hypothetical protein
MQDEIHVHLFSNGNDANRENKRGSFVIDLATPIQLDNAYDWQVGLKQLDISNVFETISAVNANDVVRLLNFDHIKTSKNFNRPFNLPQFLKLCLLQSPYPSYYDDEYFAEFLNPDIYYGSHDTFLSAPIQIVPPRGSIGPQVGENAKENIQFKWDWKDNKVSDFLPPVPNLNKTFFENFLLSPSFTVTRNRPYTLKQILYDAISELLLNLDIKKLGGNLQSNMVQTQIRADNNVNDYEQVDPLMSTHHLNDDLELLKKLINKHAVLRYQRDYFKYTLKIDTLIRSFIDIFRSTIDFLLKHDFDLTKRINHVERCHFTLLYSDIVKPINLNGIKSQVLRCLPLSSIPKTNHFFFENPIFEPVAKNLIHSINIHFACEHGFPTKLAPSTKPIYLVLSFKKVNK